jgi:ubiquinone/menaquinone biosynthesis C-methylase UbiE
VTIVPANQRAALDLPLPPRPDTRPSRGWRSQGGAPACDMAIAESNNRPGPHAFLDLLQCPASGLPLCERDGHLAVEGNTAGYRITASGIPLFADRLCSDEGRRQQDHFDRVAERYLENLGYAHTREYMAYLDAAFLAEVGDAACGNCAELCCGGGEAFRLLGRRVKRGVGVDVSLSMLEAARAALGSDNYFFAQGDATFLPLRDDAFDSVFMLGGIHHVNDRLRLFQEIHRILKPGGRFYFREPVSDFFPWRWLRSLIYRLSPALDDRTERPLLRRETEGPLHAAGLRLRTWRTFGFLGYCLLMNSDVLVLNRWLRFVPGIRSLTRWATRFDDWTVRLPGMAGNGLIVVGSAMKPPTGESP